MIVPTQWAISPSLGLALLTGWVACSIAKTATTSFRR